ncbi:U3 small nucleolar RNA-associated protein 6-like protein [Cryptotermes secundus]|uniref:U3 small nucleolar RNA-associated protein 6-like protein n=2 Tax=Cryptotermes secundus TaxID=105785 RepID=A0A2J7QS59_9NEOP|nr:U3 small nucleolar RNA-associated protein 6-like protein [Cryptotermes secundus]
MAEFVEYRAEGMIPELEQMGQIGLFEKHEIRTIIKKRKEFEYKIQRRTKCKEDHLRYIQYEMDLLKLLRLRREKKGVTHKKADIEFVITNRVNRLFKQAIQRFKDDVKLWISYIKFCKQMRFRSSVSRTLVQMLQVHSDKPKLWRLAANWEFEESHSVENARQFLLRGLRFHPGSKCLFAEAFRLELQYAAMKRKQQREKKEVEGRKNPVGERSYTSVPSSTEEEQTHCQHDGTEEVSDQVLEGRLAEVIYESAIKKIHDVHFLIDLLAIAKEYDFTSKLQFKMVTYMIQTFSNDEFTWDTMARRELEGLTYIDPQFPEESNLLTAPSGTSEIDEDGNNSKNSCLKQRIRQCCGVYVAVLKQLPTEKMWSLYLDMLLELNQDLTYLPRFKKNLLRVAFQDAHSAGCMQEKYYLLWVDMLKSQKKFKKLEDVLRKATERIRSSVQLWQARLSYHLSRDEDRLGQAVFQDATVHLGCDSKAALPLWELMLQYYQTKDMHKVEQIFQDGVVQGPAISLNLKPMYIEWLVLAKGIVAARKVYESLSIQPPLCLELHTRMAALESTQPDMNPKHVRKCCEMACNQFGKSNTDVWMEYIKFEQERGNAKRVSEIYMRAVKSLDPVYSDSFVTEFSLLKTGMTISPKPSA